MPLMIVTSSAFKQRKWPSTYIFKGTTIIEFGKDKILLLLLRSPG